MKTCFVLTDLEEIKSSCERIMQASQQSSRLPRNQAGIIQLPLCFYPVSCPSVTQRRLRSNKHQAGFFKEMTRWSKGVHRVGDTTSYAVDYKKDNSGSSALSSIVNLLLMPPDTVILSAGCSL